jgi:hypothetical protein
VWKLWPHRIGERDHFWCHASRTSACGEKDMSANSIKLSQGFEVLRPKNDKMIPIPCKEWDYLLDQIKDLTTEPWLFQTAGSNLIGASLATAIAIWTGAVAATATAPNSVIIAWAVTAACFVCGLACIYFAHKERAVHRAKASAVVMQMKLIEERFEREEN